ANTHDRSHQRRHADGCAREKEHPDDPGKRARKRSNDDERIEPALKVNYHQEVDQHYCKSDTNPEPDVRRIHALNLTTNCERSAARQLRLHLIDYFLNLLCDSPQISVLGVRVDIEDRLHIVMAY